MTNNAVGIPLEFSDSEAVKAFISSNTSGIYHGKNTDDEEVVVYIQQGKEMTVHTYQANGWIRINYYDKDGYSEGETFEGRWNK